MSPKAPNGALFRVPINEYGSRSDTSYVRFLTLALLLLALPAQAATPVDATVMTSKGKITTLRAKGARAAFPKGEGVCVYRNRKAAACGYVTGTTPSTVTLQLTHGKPQMTPKEKLLLNVQAKYAKGAKPTAQETSSGPSGVPPGKTINAAIGGGFSGPGDYYWFPFLHGQYLVSPKITVGLMPLLFSSSSPTGNLSAFGVYLSAFYYLDKGFDGLYLAGMGGIYSMSVTLTSGEKASAMSPAFILGGGYHITLPSGLNFFATAGANLVLTTSGTGNLGSPINFGLKSFYPHIHAGLGYLF